MVRVLEQAGFQAMAAADAPAALRRLSAERFEALLIDVRLPGASGFDLLQQVKAAHPVLPTALMTAYAGGDVAGRARASGVDAFLPKPIEPHDLVEQVDALVRKGRAAAGGNDRVLAIGAHPGDVEAGVGGTLLRHRGLGDDVVMLVLGTGAHGAVAATGRAGAARSEARAEQARRAAALLGARLVLHDLPPAALQAGDPAVEVIGAVVADVAPTVVYTHSRHDGERDHRAAHAASLAATAEVPVVYCYETSAASPEFRPGRFVPVDPVVAGKCRLLGVYGGGGDDPADAADQVDPDLAMATCRYWGRLGGSRYCEALEVVRAAGERGRYATGSLVTGR